jgi:bisphosphoglycerate-dependent phosphoglycerate mutase
MSSTLILLRHGESEWNALNQFTGWVDVDINDKGVAEAKKGAELLKAEGLLPDGCTPLCFVARFTPPTWLSTAATATGSR